MQIINNPFDWVIEATRQLYPEAKAIIQFNPNIKFKKMLWFKFGYCGCTTFPDDGSAPLVDISINIPFEDMVEILAHELAHVVTPSDKNHGQEWENAFQSIQVKYCEIAEGLDSYAN